MEYSPQQARAIEKAAGWLKQCSSEKGRGGLSKPFFYLAGYAGTGKSTIASHLAELQNNTTVYGAFTGKAAKVMRDNDCEGASTIHSLIYKPSRDTETGQFVFNWNPVGACSQAGLIIIDECSMVNEELAKGLLKYKKPILVLGDPGQLPPVKGAGYFTGGAPDSMLDEIHRQAADSNIIRIATEIRQGLWTPNEFVSDDLVVVKAGTDVSSAVETAGALIVGKNSTRHSYNDRMRQRKGFGNEPVPKEGETLICLKNDKDLGIFNGETWDVHKYKGLHRHKGENFHSVRLKSQDDPNWIIQTHIHECFFNRTTKPFWKVLNKTQEFDFGYVLTAHKSQGSAWPRVVVFDESEVFRDQADRWLYTACTRAAKKLTVVV